MWLTVHQRTWRCRKKTWKIFSCKDFHIIWDIYLFFHSIFDHLDKETLESLRRQNTLWHPVSMWRDTIMLHRYLSKIEHSFSHSVFITGKPVFCSNETSCGFEQSVTRFCVCVREGGDTHRQGERNRINPRGRWKHITVGGNKHIHTPELLGLQESKW